MIAFWPAGDLPSCRQNNADLVRETGRDPPQRTLTSGTIRVATATLNNAKFGHYELI
jgi:hypothetical protein